MTILEQLERLATLRPTDYFGDLYEYLDNGFGRVFAVHRDSDYIARSNWDTVIEHFNENFKEAEEETWSINSANHWAVGWVNELLVKIKDSEGNYTPEFLYMVGICERLENYSILDEEKASQYEWDENHPELDDTCYSDDPDCDCGRKKA